MVGDDMMGGSLGYNDHGIEFSIFSETRRGSNKICILDFWKTDFSPSRVFIWRLPWERALKNKEVQEGWTAKPSGASNTSSSFISSATC